MTKLQSSHNECDFTYLGNFFVFGKLQLLKESRFSVTNLTDLGNREFMKSTFTLCVVYPEVPNLCIGVGYIFKMNLLKINILIYCAQCS